ncbi:cold shock domain-containing protein [Micromonospora sp. FIMYZ51]|uniref:cold-shock protein n=1 Tax=Micromonospora sp. FIMYZ51 TaxID=3051832 RepID=UPI00311EA75B
MAVRQGKVIRFNVDKGYGFIAAEGGDEDVFLHASVLRDVHPHELRPGMLLEYEAVEGNDGVRAVLARPANGVEITSRPISGSDSADADTCDVVGRSEYERFVTDLLLSSSSNLTTGEVLKIRSGLARYALDRKWLDA